MGSALLNMRRLKNCIIIIWSFLLVAFSIIISSDGVGKLENVLLLALPMTLFCFFGYVAMRSWKFGVAFPICVAFVIYYMFPFEYVYTLFFLLYIEFFFVCVNFIKDNPYRNYVIAILFVLRFCLITM